MEEFGEIQALTNNLKNLMEGKKDYHLIIEQEDGKAYEAFTSAFNKNEALEQFKELPGVWNFNDTYLLSQIQEIN